MSEQWYALHTKPYKEPFVCNRLLEQDITVYFPCLTQTNRLKPFFPGYLFVHADLDTTGINRFNWLPGSRGLVSFSDYPAVVPDAVIATLRERIAALKVAPDPGIAHGARVKITSGPLAGYEAVFDRYLSGRERVLVLMGLLGSGARAVKMKAEMVIRI